MQETCFAREIIAQYGKHSIPWPQLEDMVKRLTTIAGSCMSGILYPEGRLILRLIWFTSALRDLRNYIGKRSMDLGRLISFSRIRMTSDPRDKIFVL